MLTISLIAAPGGLPSDVVNELKARWNGIEVTHLSPEEAVEFVVRDVPHDFEKWRAELDRRAIDLNIMPNRAREKHLLLADMDSTIIEQECIDELADHLGVGKKVSEITARAMNGELDFNAALEARVALLAGLPVEAISEVLDTRISLARGAVCLLKTMRARGAHAVLVSGGFTDFSAVIAQRVGFDAHHANKLLRDPKTGVLSGKVAYPILGRSAKLDTMHMLMRRLDLDANQVLSVGDGANDLDMLQNAGLGVALHAKPSVADKCEVRINHGDLTSLLFLQGITRDAFK